MDDTATAATVDGLMAAAGLHPTAEERTRLVAVYLSHRQGIDSLYAIDEVRYEAPGTIFDPAPDFTDWASE